MGSWHEVGASARLPPLADLDEMRDLPAGQSESLSLGCSDHPVLPPCLTKEIRGQIGTGIEHDWIFPAPVGAAPCLELICGQPPAFADDR